MNNRYYKVSVLMLAYNQEQYIDEAIRSVVMQQTNFDFELIIGDDGSTDGTAQRCRFWQQRYPDRIRLLDHPDNVGLARNFVRTYNEAQGEYIAICEADDFWTDKHKLQIQVDFLDAHAEYAMCFHRVVNYYEANNTKSLSNGGQKSELTISDVAMCNPITNVSVCYRRAMAGTLPEWMDCVTSYDLVMHLLTLQHGKAFYMKRVMAVYRKLATSIWTGGDKSKRAMISLKNRDLLIDFFDTRNAEVTAILRRANALNCLDMALYAEGQQQHEAAENYRHMALRYEPSWTAADIEREQQALAHRQRPSLCHQWLSACRALVSRLIPLPHIRS